MENKALERLARGIQRCQKCERSQTRRHVVPGEGDPSSGMLLMGEAPGKKEDKTGRPFVGRAGDYLEKILSLHNLDRNQVFITSVLKCYHPQSPKKKQIEECLLWSSRQIDSLNPKLILVMGRWAAWALLGMENLEGVPKLLTRKGRNWVVTCHPAAAMRFPDRDREFQKGFKIFASKAAELDLRRILPSKTKGKSAKN
jgi:uracil-DNA glycosylase family 4